MDELISLLAQFLERGVRIEITIKPLQDETPASVPDVEQYPAICPDCGWSSWYATPEKARRALNTHRSRHCTAGAAESDEGSRRDYPNWLTDQHAESDER